MTKVEVENEENGLLELLHKILIQNKLEEVVLVIYPLTTFNQKMTITLGRDGSDYSIVNGTDPVAAGLVNRASSDYSRMVVFTLNVSGEAWFHNIDADPASASHTTPEDRWNDTQQGINNAVHSQELSFRE